MKEKTCFLVAPIGKAGSEVRKRADTMLLHVIKPGTERAGWRVLRADQIVAPGAITAQVTRHLLEDPLVIADLSGSNPNVMYELGVRHSVGKPTIQITTDPHHLPFDIVTMRTIIVDLKDLESIKSAAEKLQRTIVELERHPELFESPVSAAVDLRSFEALKQEEPDFKDPSLRGAFLNVLKDMENRMKALEHTVTRTLSRSEKGKDYSRKIFIVHGHDSEIKTELARLLERLDFEPVILHEQPDRGQTVFSKLNGELGDIGFTFVILTPDDVGSTASDQQNLKPRARQNVVFEHGLFAGYLKPERVCAIRRGDVEIPSDLHGVLYKTVPIDGSIRSIALEIANELRAAGYIVDANKLLAS